MSACMSRGRLQVLFSCLSVCLSSCLLFLSFFVCLLDPSIAPSIILIRSFIPDIGLFASRFPLKYFFIDSNVC